MFPLTIWASGQFGVSGDVILEGKVTEQKEHFYTDWPNCAISPYYNNISFSNIYYYSGNGQFYPDSAFISNGKFNVGDQIFVVGHISDGWDLRCGADGKRASESTGGFINIFPLLAINLTSYNIQSPLLLPFLMFLILSIIALKTKKDLFFYIGLSLFLYFILFFMISNLSYSSHLLGLILLIDLVIIEGLGILLILQNRKKADKIKHWLGIFFLCSPILFILIFMKLSAISFILSLILIVIGTLIKNKVVTKIGSIFVLISFLGWFLSSV